jgi:hypothetical protein
MRSNFLIFPSRDLLGIRKPLVQKQIAQRTKSLAFEEKNFSATSYTKALFRKPRVVRRISRKV